MDYQLAATSIIVPAAISLIVAVINNQRQKRLEFDYDYRKYILDKRKKAYERIEFFIADFEAFDFKLYDIPESDWVGLDNLREQLKKINFNSIWISGTMLYVLGFIRVTLKDINTLYQANEPISEDDQKKIELKTRKALTVILREYFKDISNLDGIEKFKRKKLKEYDGIKKHSGQKLIVAYELE